VKHALPAGDLTPGLARENDAWAPQTGLPATQELMGAALQNGAQTPDGERDLEALMRSVAQ
jgi:hypothetical protein